MRTFPKRNKTVVQKRIWRLEQENVNRTTISLTFRISLTGCRRCISMRTKKLPRHWWDREWLKWRNARGNEILTEPRSPRLSARLRINSWNWRATMMWRKLSKWSSRNKGRKCEACRHALYKRRNIIEGSDGFQDITLKYADGRKFGCVSMNRLTVIFTAIENLQRRWTYLGVHFLEVWSIADEEE